MKKLRIALAGAVSVVWLTTATPVFACPHAEDKPAEADAPKTADKDKAKDKDTAKPTEKTKDTAKDKKSEKKPDTVAKT